MNTKHFESIIELARTKNFNRAAENLYMSQPSLTYQINSIEQEIGFRLFDRSGKGAMLTPAGEQFIATIRDMNTQLIRAIEQGQNFSTRYRDNIRIGMSVRSAIYYLPEIINLFHEEEPSVSITPIFDYHDHIEPFLAGETDILFAIRDSIRHLPDIRIHDFYDSHLYLVCNRNDPLAERKLICKEDLKGRTLMIGGGSPGPLKKLQQEIIQDPEVSYFNSNDHDTSLTFVATGTAVVISPGLLNDHNPQFAWIPYDTEQTISCVLCTHASDKRTTLNRLLELMIDTYSKKTDH